MKRWKVIATVLLIFASGAVTGALALRTATNRAAAERDPFPPSLMDMRFGALETMQRELQLDEAQTRRIEGILQEGRRRTREVWESCQPQFRAEFKRVRELISAELSPEQQARFEDLLKKARERHKEKDKGRPEKPGDRAADAPPAPGSPGTPETTGPR